MSAPFARVNPDLIPSLRAIENFEGVIIAATNFMDRLDPAVLRRFTLKFRFGYLAPVAKRTLFARMFKVALPPSDAVRLDAIPNLVPGDFRTVRQSFHYLDTAPTPSALLSALSAESALKRDAPSSHPVGFSPCPSSLLTSYFLFLTSLSSLVTRISSLRAPRAPPPPPSRPSSRFSSHSSLAAFRPTPFNLPLATLLSLLHSHPITSIPYSSTRPNHSTKPSCGDTVWSHRGKHKCPKHQLVSGTNQLKLFALELWLEPLPKEVVWDMREYSV